MLYKMYSERTSMSINDCTSKAGASVGILVWYGQPSEVQFPRGGVVAEPKILEN